MNMEEKVKWWNLKENTERKAHSIINNAQLDAARIMGHAQADADALRKLTQAELFAANDLRGQADALGRQANERLEAAKLYPLTPQEYLNGLAVDADQLTFRACMTTLRALREVNIIPPMCATTTALHEHAGYINALNEALNRMESERKAAMKKVNETANKPSSNVT